MLLQALCLIAIMAVLASSILMETLLAAKTAFHQRIVATTQGAMADGTAMFVDWAQSQVQHFGSGAATAWPAQSAPLKDANVCALSAGTAGATPGPCPLSAYVTWKVTGATSSANSAGTPSSDSSTATNLAPTVNEQRLSVTISVRVTDFSGKVLYGARSRELTARVFEAAPYIVVSGARDIGSQGGTLHDNEGDTAGAARFAVTVVRTPDPEQPASDTDTEITTSVTCSNSRNIDETSPFSDAAAPGDIDYSLHPYGNRDWAYETPCQPVPGAPTAPAGLSGYVPPVGNVYASSPDGTHTSVWSKGDANSATFPL